MNQRQTLSKFHGCGAAAAGRLETSCLLEVPCDKQCSDLVQVISKNKQTMTLNCLTCRSPEGTDSVNGRRRSRQPDGSSFKSLWGKNSDRRSSGSMSPRSEPLRTQKTIERAKITPRRLKITVSALKDSNGLSGEGEPRLVRSPGLRRDWSFENSKAMRKLEEK